VHSQGALQSRLVTRSTGALAQLPSSSWSSTSCFASVFTRSLSRAPAARWRLSSSSARSKELAGARRRSAPRVASRSIGVPTARRSERLARVAYNGEDHQNEFQSPFGVRAVTTY
jgi:hypothetical protein